MHTVGILLIGMALGIAMLYLTNFIVSKANARLNYGQKVRFEGEVIGHISVCRYHGVKKYFFTTKNFGPLNPTSFYEREDAISACRKAHLDEMLKQQAERPKQTSVPRVA
jgi:hypothetical protein